MLWLLFKVCFCLKFCLQFLAFALDNSDCFYGWLSTYLEDVMKRVRVNIFEEIWDHICELKEKNDPTFSVLTRL